MQRADKKEKERKKEEEEIYDPNFERKLDEVTAEFQPHIRNHLLTRISRSNAQLIVAYMLAFNYEVNPSHNYRLTTITILKQLCDKRAKGIDKPLKEMNTDDIITFLERLRKTNIADPSGAWIGTYNINLIIIKRFFKWLYYPNLPPNRRPKPAVIEPLVKQRRKDSEIYNDENIWTNPEYNRIFFRYCPSPRDRAFHAMMLDASTRPGEMFLGLKIGEIEFVQDGPHKNGYIKVTGKSGKKRRLPLYNSIPFLRKWLNSGLHPRSTDENAYVFCGTGKRNIGRRLNKQAFSHKYAYYRKVYFPKLLDDPTVSPEDKKIIQEMLTKVKWRPNALRHTSLSEKSKIIGEYELREHADWSPTSHMPRRYLHFDGKSSSNSILKAMGRISEQTQREETAKRDALKPKICGMCGYENEHESRFCNNANCGMPLTFKDQVEKLKEAESTKKQLEEMKQEWKIQQEEIRRISDYISKINFKKGEEPVLIGAPAYTEKNNG